MKTRYCWWEDEGSSDARVVQCRIRWRSPTQVQPCGRLGCRMWSRRSSARLFELALFAGKLEHVFLTVHRNAKGTSDVLVQLDRLAEQGRRMTALWIVEIGARLMTV